MVRENATENRACRGGWGTRSTSSGTCGSGVYGNIGTGDVLFYMYNHFTGTDGMNRNELLEQVDFYRKLAEEQSNIIESLRNSIDDMRKDYKESQCYIKNLLKQIADLTEKLDKVLFYHR